MNENMKKIIKICMKCALDDFEKTKDTMYIDEYNVYKNMLDDVDALDVEIVFNTDKLNRLRLCS